MANRWQRDFNRFKPGSYGETVWIGSSIIRLWDLEQYFPGREYINRGFGGGTAAECLEYFDVLVTPLKPRQIVLYAGDNDLAEGVSTSEVVQILGKLLSRSIELTDRVVYIPIKPSRMRHHLLESQKYVNGVVASMSKITTVPPLNDFLVPGQTFCEERYLMGDGLHLNEEGYTLMTKLVSPWL